jgi:hypothetical protein
MFNAFQQCHQSSRGIPTNMTHNPDAQVNERASKQGRPWLLLSMSFPITDNHLSIRKMCYSLKNNKEKACPYF